jgi:hypothetical protein
MVELIKTFLAGLAFLGAAFLVLGGFAWLCELFPAILVGL